jgi:DNA-binding GntR family transcriptional regulator
MSLAANDPRPKPVQVAEALRERIKEGTTYPNGKLPPSRDLAKEFGVAGQTLRDGLQILVSEGLIVAAHRGYFISEGGEVAAAPKPDMHKEIKEIRSQIQTLTKRVEALEERSASGGA